MNEIFKLDEFENETIVESADIGNDSIDDDIDENINESGNNEIPEQPTAKLEGDTTNQLPGGEQPATRPKDETKIMNGSGTEIKADVYNSAMDALKKSFKEATELIDMLTNCTIVESTLEDQQDEFTENAIYESYINGPYFERVARTDKDEVKEIVKSIKSKITSKCKGKNAKFYQPNRFMRWFVSGEWWYTRLWQILGVVLIEEHNVDEIAKDLTEQLKDELGEYKILPAKAPWGFLDMFRTKFNWKNQWEPYFLLVDRKLDNEIKKKIKEDEKENKEAEKKEEK